MHCGNASLAAVAVGVEKRSLKADEILEMVVCPIASFVHVMTSEGALSSARW